MKTTALISNIINSILLTPIIIMFLLMPVLNMILGIILLGLIIISWISYKKHSYIFPIVFSSLTILSFIIFFTNLLFFSNDLLPYPNNVKLNLPR